MKKLLAILLSTVLVASMLVAIVPASAAATNVLLGKEVTLGENTQVSAYAGALSVVTDGKISADGWGAAAVDRIDKSEGVSANATLNFAAFEETAISSAVLTVTRGGGLGVPYEPWIEALVNGEWTFISWLTGEEAATGSYEMSATFEPVTTTQVRLVWYGFGWAPIDEFAVYAEEASVPSVPESSDPETSTPNTTDVDLVSGSSVAFENITANGGEGRADIAVITDDVVPGTPVNIWGAGLWYGLKGTDSAVKSYITFDAFDGAYSITNASVALGVDHPSGIGVPGSVTLEGLANGEWVELGTFDMSGVPAWSAESTYVELYVADYTATADTAVTQVRLAFYSYGWNWIGEIDVVSTVAETEPSESEPESSEPESSEPESSEPESSEPESSEPEITEPSREEEVQELMGEANPDSVYDVIVIAPDEVVAGREFDVTVSFDNITTPLDSISATLNFDYAYATLQNALEGFAIPSAWDALVDGVIVDERLDEWEDMTRVDRDNNDVINPGVILIENGTAGTIAGGLESLTESGVLTYTFTFVASADATEIAFYIPHESVTAMEMLNYTEYVGNGSYKIVKVVADSSDESSEPESSEPESSEPESSEPESSEPESSEPESSEPESSEPESSEPESSEPESSEPESSEPESSEPESSEPESSEPEASEPSASEPTETPDTGDASSILVFVVLALVALAGSAVVIKSRK